MRLREDIDPLSISPGDLGGGCFPADLRPTPGDQRIPKSRPSNGEADKPWHTSSGGEPGLDMGFVLSPAENDAAHVAAPISASGLGQLYAILAAIQALDLPDIGLDARLL